jgi:hypothetical protein
MIPTTTRSWLLRRLAQRIAHILTSTKCFGDTTMAETTPERTSIQQPERTPENIGHQSGGESHAQQTADGGQTHGK